MKNKKIFVATHTAGAFRRVCIGATTHENSAVMPRCRMRRCCC